MCPGYSPRSSISGSLSLLFFTLLAIGPAGAGPNGGGVLVAHDAGLLLSATNGDAALCDQGSVPSGMSDVDARIDGADSYDTAAFFVVYAIFPSSARLSQVTFGTEYTDIALVQSAVRACDSMEEPMAGWPGSGTGTAVVFSTPRLSAVVPLYSFAGYMDAQGRPAAPSVLALTPHPLEGGWFRDDSSPPRLDPVAGYGGIGFNMEGVPPNEDGACCDRRTGACRIAHALDCGDDLYLGAGTACEPDPCGVTGACCGLSSFLCEDFSSADCLARGGYFQGLYTSCNLDAWRCEPLGLGACCNGSDCMVIAVEECPSDQPFLPGIACDPEWPPCVPGAGACCRENGSCSFLPPEFCGGTFLGVGIDCTELPCAAAWGACCDGDTCGVSHAQDCSVSWIPGGSCVPVDDCLSLGACYLPDGSCIEVPDREQCPGLWVASESCEGPPPPSGACCDEMGCRLDVHGRCMTLENWWIEGAPCDSCKGACWLPYGGCTFVFAFYCNGVWVGGRTCDPDLPYGACCRQDGTCSLSIHAECYAPDTWILGNECSPALCSEPVERVTWGRIKAGYGSAAP